MVRTYFSLGWDNDCKYWVLTGLSLGTRIIIIGGHLRDLYLLGPRMFVRNAIDISFSGTVCITLRIAL
jgi:hypothetical protein